MQEDTASRCILVSNGVARWYIFVMLNDDFHNIKYNLMYNAILMLKIHPAECYFNFNRLLNTTYTIIMVPVFYYMLYAFHCTTIIRDNTICMQAVWFI